MEHVLVNINGRICGPEEATVSVFDRSYLYGDSLYEVVRTYDGIPYTLKEHLERLERSALLCHMVLSQPRELFELEIRRTLEAFQNQFKEKEAYLRLVVSRGVGKIGFGLSALKTGTQYVIIAQTLEEPSEAVRKSGIKLKIIDRLRNDPRALDPAMKSGNYLNCLLGYLEAQSDGFDDAVLMNSEGHITEGTTFNLFYVKDGKLATSPLDIGILAGITRDRVIAIAQRWGMEISEARFPKSYLYEADEVFITGTVKEILGVSNLDGKKIGTGKVGPITQKLFQEFRKQIKAELS